MVAVVSIIIFPSDPLRRSDSIWCGDKRPKQGKGIRGNSVRKGPEVYTGMFRKHKGAQVNGAQEAGLGG